MADQTLRSIADLVKKPKNDGQITFKRDSERFKKDEESEKENNTANSNKQNDSKIISRKRNYK